MLNKIIYPLFLIALAFLLFSSNDSTIIIGGIAIFIIGMFFMEDGFKFFSGGFLEKIVQNSSNTTLKAIFTGFISTTVVQSSSLISVIIISFLTAEIITLTGAIGIIFGANIGSTSTAWIISTLGMKIDLAIYALPLIIFGIVLKLNNNKNYQGIGDVFAGIGFIFLGIDYMKDGFDTLKNSIDISSYAMEGILGAIVYVLVGAIATVIIQSSAATMAIILTAVATSQITYINALELAIGANIGTTITAFLASLASNTNGKRLAIAHFIFNGITAIIALIFLNQLSKLVDILASYFGILENDYAMKLALFHTIFNILGVLIMIPFMNKLVAFLESLFKGQKTSKLKALYLDSVVVQIPDAAISSVRKEIIHLFDNSVEVISHALFLHRHNFLGSNDIKSVVKNSNLDIKTDVNEFYSQKIKDLYGELIHYSTMAQEYMNDKEKGRIYELKIASRYIVESIKDIRELQKNIFIYLKSDNENIKEEYNLLRIKIAKTIKIINDLKESKDKDFIKNKLDSLEENLKNYDDINSDKIDNLIRNHKITTKMATSLINDSMYAQNISKQLFEMAKIIWNKNY